MLAVHGARIFTLIVILWSLFCPLTCLILPCPNLFLGTQNTQLVGLEEVLELFCKGECLYGPYWEHALGYWKASQEHPDKILFFKYEEMMEDTVSYVKRLAEFIWRPFSSEEEERGDDLK
ncbi:putative nascent polypeptide associated complex alpha subunit [Hibiscus syriacus]|uniref:Sulfotransferase n=1 Tax=Hibiscus syriacus TaxID=106335 RepID=A0A6A3CQI9_HIBSY|nr:putative nascent polypeptide associated complex alpha subunit [Hibiscus syriacus]